MSHKFLLDTQTILLMLTSSIKLLSGLLLIALFASCSSTQEKNSPIAVIESAHKKESFLQEEAIQFDLYLEFRGTERLNGTITLLTNSAKAMIELKDSTRIIVNQDRAFHSPDYKNPGSVRFAAYTWSYFFLFPYKLSDPGTHWDKYGAETIEGVEYERQKLTFDAGTGDAPDDWYIAYPNPESHLIDISAYIVTAGSSVKEAEEDPHAIQYLDYELVDGIPLARRWVFWEWRENKGLTQELGLAKLSNFKFLDLPDDYFEVPSGYMEK